MKTELHSSFVIKFSTFALLVLCLIAPRATAQTGFGSALSFDGVDDHVSVAPNAALDLTDGTIEFWLNRGAIVGNACLVQNRGYTLAQTRYSVHLSTTAIGLFDGISYQTVPLASAPGQWYHVALVCAGGNTEVFVNGTSRGFTGNAFNPGVNGQPFRIGATYDNSGSGTLAEPFAGQLDEVRIWNAARSQTQITNDMNNPLIGTESGLVAYYRFDEGSGTVAYDATTNHFNGQLINRPLRAPSIWAPQITLNGGNPLTNECHVPFVDPTTVNGSPVAVAAGWIHSLALKADGSVVGWGDNGYGQTIISARATNGVVAIAAGGYHSLALKADGSVVGWGRNNYGQTNVPPSATNGVVAIAAGAYHNLALKANGSVVGWGNNGSGETNTPASATNGVVAVAAGNGHSLALKADGSVVGWGYNGYGQTSIPASATNGVVAIAAGLYHSLALKADGSVVGWGLNDYGQTSIPASATNGVVAIAAGNVHSLALKADGSVVGWGVSSSQTNIPANATDGVVAIAAGNGHSLALKTDGSVVGWGYNDSGQITIPASVFQLNLTLSVTGMVDTNLPGTYGLSYSATNALGGVGTATRTVVVTDTLPPLLTLLGANPLRHGLGEPFNDPGATASDLCAGDYTASIVSNVTVNPDVPGTYTNTFTVTDANGNTAQAIRIVLVGAPLVTTLPASGLLNDAATLNGSVNPNGLEATAWFEWGTSTSYASNTSPVIVGTGTSPVPVSAALTGLTPGVTYHCRVVASNSMFVARGADQVFWSPAIVLNSSNPRTNECHAPFMDPATVKGFPVAIAAGYNHSLALKADGSVVAWGGNDYGQTIIPPSATNGVVAIAAGWAHSLALKADGSVVGWGYNNNGQTSIPASATNGVVAIAAGGAHSLALKADGSVVGWGDNGYGQANIPASATNGVVAIAAGDSHSLALKADGSVVGWGDNRYGKTIIPASATSGVVAIAASVYHSLALKADGSVVGWGANDYGQTSIPASATNGVVAIAAGNRYSLALKADDSVVGWGYNGSGQTSIPASATNGVVAIAAGDSHSLALKADGSVVGWGYNGYGQRSIPANLSLLNLALSVTGTVDANPPGTYVLTYSATNALGGMGTATRTVVVTDTLPPLLTLLGANPLRHGLGTPYTDPGATASDLCTGDLTASIVSNVTVNPNIPGTYTNTFAVTDANGKTVQAIRIVLVGAPIVTTLPASGLLNDAATLNGSVNPNGMDATAWFEWGTAAGYASNTLPVILGRGTAAVPVSAALTGLIPGVMYHCRVVASNSVFVAYGADQIFWSPAIVLNGPNPLTNECHAAFIAPGGQVTASPLAIAAGGYHSLALKADGSVIGWGAGGPGQLANPHYGQTSIPTSATNGVVAIAAGGYQSLALKADGSVVGWGHNNYGQTNTPASATNGVVAIAAGMGHSLALKADGSVVGWGYNNYGQTNTPASATNGVVAIAAGMGHSLALKADGSVVGWGYNYYGQTNIPASATNGVVAIAAGESHSLALKADGSVVGWGYNIYGQRSIPASATNGVVAIAAGNYHSLALKADGSVIGWGNNSSGQRSIPASATNGVVAIAAGGSHSLALKADGSVVGWGLTNYGQTSIPASGYQLNLALSVTGTVDVNLPGTYVLSYSATNALGAVSTATRTVVVADTLPPLLTLLGANPLIHNAGTPYTDPGATASDLCAGDLTASIVSNVTVNPNVLGTYTNTFTVTDASGNIAQAIRIVLVGAPLVTTLPASGLLNDAATLNGSVNPNGADTTAWFEWGTSTSYASNTPPIIVANGTSPAPVSAALAGLTPGVMCHYRVVASNSVGVTRGADQVFWSPAIVLNGPNPLTNECHAPFMDLATVNGSPGAIAAGGYHSLALKADGSVVGWGRNNYGQTNTPASATNGVVAIAAGWSHSLALKADGSVVGWGYNGYGLTNMPASATNGVVAIAAGNYHSLVFKADGSVVGWGDNYYGQTNIPASATNVVVAIAAGYYHSLALKAGGSVVGWGNNDFGQTSIPASASNGVVAIAAGGSHSLALKADGSVIGWGNNSSGQRSIPASATNGVVAIAGGADHSLVLKADGSVVGWGANGFGQTSIPASATNGVVAIAAAYNFSLALKADGSLIGWGVNDCGQASIPASAYQLNLALSATGTVNTNLPGTYTLTYSATNALGAVGTATHTVVVADTLPPLLTLLGANPLIHVAGTPYADPGATASDLCTGDLSASIVANVTVNPNVPGTYTNTYTVFDAGGNSAWTNRVVTVVAPSAPVFAASTVPAPGQFRLQATGSAGLTYTLQTSTNLMDWLDCTNLIAAPGGLIDCLLNVETNSCASFYRLKWP